MKVPKLISLTVLLFVQAAVTTVFAQDKPKAGDTISGIVCPELPIPLHDSTMVKKNNF